MDKIVSKIAALGVPGLVLTVAIGATGLAGGAAITTALAAIGQEDDWRISNVGSNWSYFGRYIKIRSGRYLFGSGKGIIPKRRN